MSLEERKTKLVFEVIQKLSADGTTEFRPGHVADALRKTPAPMLSWEIRGEFSKLEAAGLIAADPASGRYRLVEKRSRKSRKAG